MAKSGIKPIVFIYSTFLQRSYDQIIHDVCLQNLPVIFSIDRAGLVGLDGKTHQGVFDLSYLTHVPNLTVISPKDESELKLAFLTALELNKPVAIRYPNGEICSFETKSRLDANLKWEILTEGDDNVILAVGPRMIKLALDISSKYFKPITIINARTIKPLDTEVLYKIKDKNIITLEENVEIGGFGALVLKYYSDNDILANVKVFGVKDDFVKHASVERQLEINGLSHENIIKYLR